jgi:single-strand DNA-binding protein
VRHDAAPAASNQDQRQPVTTKRAAARAGAAPRQPSPLDRHTNHQTGRNDADVNTINLTGRLTQDPELRALPSGEHACRMRVAVDGMGRGGPDQVGYINITAYGKPAQAAHRVLAKGWLVAVDGRLQYGEWETDAGERRHDYQVVGSVEFLAAPRSTTSEDEQPAAAAA